MLRDLSFSKKGDEVEVGGFNLNYDALVESGFLEEITPRVACPACDAAKSVKKDDVPHFQKQETLEEHYASEHPALSTPDFEEIV